MNLDARKYADATQRNRQPILEVLQRILPPPKEIFSRLLVVQDNMRFSSLLN